ncbi:hypothetical protein CEXT_774601 [Caerostris extrusa]|uniref:Uncharacterized protein n=1 Tax=Caerostris extrusa TaxID=172846 RepID=A0AAV4VI46_CAEEX|nr:hypothetical protein CEXT_774601 [Caerostris extrusa]
MASALLLCRDLKKVPSGLEEKSNDWFASKIFKNSKAKQHGKINTLDQWIPEFQFLSNNGLQQTDSRDPTIETGNESSDLFLLFLSWPERKEEEIDGTKPSGRPYSGHIPLRNKPLALTKSHSKNSNSPTSREMFLEIRYFLLPIDHFFSCQRIFEPNARCMF